MMRHPGDDEPVRHTDDDERMRRTGDDEIAPHTDDDEIEEPARKFERLAEDPEAMTAQRSDVDEVRRMAERSEAGRSGEAELESAVESAREQGRYWDQT